MSTVNSNYITMLDLAMLPENKDAKDIIMMLKARNPIVEDALTLPCNDGTSHKTTVWTGLPSSFWGRVYKGVPATKGTMQSVKDTTGFVESASQVDCRIVDIFEKAEDKASARLEHAQLHIESMSQEGAQAIFYHDSAVDPERPTGFAPRFNSLSAENGSQIVDGGGSGSDLTSMWMITWDKMGSHLIHPKSSPVGITRKDGGIIYVPDVSGNLYAVYREDFAWHFGLSVRNWKYVARGANIATGSLKEDASTGVNIDDMLTEMYYRHMGRVSALGKTCIYMNTTIVKYLDYQARLSKDRNLFLTFDKYGPNAKEILHYRGIPIRECDALINGEDEVV